MGNLLDKIYDRIDPKLFTIIVCIALAVFLAEVVGKL